MRKTPTEKQYQQLLVLGSGNMVISGGSRTLRAMVKRGWLTTDPPGSDNGFRITADGFRALGLAVDAYGLPSIGRPPAKPTLTPLQKVRAELREAERATDRESARAHRAELKLDRIRELVA